jgi:hypothetical protein
MVTADDMGNQGMTIQSLSFKASSISNPTGPYNNFEIFIGHTALSELTEVFDNNWSTSGALVYADPSLELTGIEGEQWFTFLFSSPFQYDGSSNLLIETVWDGPVSPPDGSIYVMAWIADGNRSLACINPSSPTGTLSNAVPQLMFEFELKLEQVTFAGIKNSFQ